MNPEEILQSYIEGRQSGEDNRLRAAIGKLSADRSKELSDAIIILQRQIPVSISDLRETITRNTDKIIESSEKLSKSNEGYAKSMRWLTIALVLVGIAGIIF